MCTGMRPGGINDDAEQKVESIMIDKKGEQLNQGDPIRWTITVNKNRLTLQNVVVKDELIGDLDLWEGELSDVRIYETDVNEKGELTPVGEAIDWQNNSDKYNVTFDAEHNTLRVAFLGTITKCYQIVFKTEAIKYDVIQEFGNKVSVEGQGIENGETEASHKVKARYIKACATGRRVRGSVKVVKKNQEGQPLKGAKFALIDWRGTKVLEKETDENGKPLKGAVFALLDESGKLIAEKETNAEGKIKFDNLDINNKKYFIKEVKQPEGYELDSKKVEFTLSETAKQFVHRHINKKSSTPSSPSLSPTPSPSPELTPSPEPTIQEPIYEEIPESPTNEQNQAIESDEAALGENAKDTKGVEAVSSEELAAEEASNEAVSDEAEALPDLGQNNEMIRFIILLGGALIISGSWLSYRRKSYK